MTFPVWSTPLSGTCYAGEAVVVASVCYPGNRVVPAVVADGVVVEFVV